EKQKKNFRLLLGFAQETVSPVVVHSRSAGKYCFDILKEFEIKNVIFHCFDGNIKLAKKIVENGWFISIPTNVCYNSMAQRYVKEIPLENLVLETDSPFLHPLQKKDEKNTPLNLKFSVKKISEITGKSEEMVVEITSENAQRIFKFKYPLE
ncbi:MAG: DNase, partial [Euryarchaeota archaeon HGW-Euryarchaeota-1]